MSASTTSKESKEEDQKGEKQQRFPVQLALYDLSHGMARSLSAQLLGNGQTIDIVPHTGVLVYGKEYFYGGGGGGISAESPNHFRETRGMAPIQIISLENATTTVTQDEFETWCFKQNTAKYAGANYDLFHNNCNHFSQDALRHGLKLTAASVVPQYILDIPQQFLNSPMGQMISPMLQGMQVSGNKGSFSPSGQGIGGSRSSTATPSNKNAPAHNPWATTTPTTPKTTKSETKSTTAVNQRPHTPVLDTHNRPLLSNDSKTATICAGKFPQHDSIQRIAALLAATTTAPIPSELLKNACDALFSQLEEGIHVTFGIMLLRLIVLRDDNDTNATQKCMEWVQRQLKTTKNESLTDPARSMAWCCMSNHVATTSNSAAIENNMVEIAFQNIDSSTRPEVKQAAASYLYNLAITLSGGKSNNDDFLSDTVVSLLCGALDGIHEETDAVTLKRRLLVVGQLCDDDANAVQLICELGFDELLRTLLSSTAAVKDGDQVQDLIDEILLLIGHVKSS